MSKSQNVGKGFSAATFVRAQPMMASHLSSDSSSSSSSVVVKVIVGEPHTFITEPFSVSCLLSPL